MRDLPGGTVTFLFTDIDGSTKLLHELGAEGYGAVLADHRRLLRETFARHGGVEVDTQGDAFFIAFADARDALEAALEGQQALADGPIRVRMGLHTGTPHVGAEGYVGADVHLGARIAAAGHGGQVLVSRETRDLVADGFELLDLGEHRLKDFLAAQWIYQLGKQRFPPLKTISNTNLPRPASSFVGRETELAEITALLTNGARMVTLSGPGGTGKTRLAIAAGIELVPEFRNGVFWVDLSTLRQPDHVADAIAHAIGAPDELAAHIAERQMLLVLDNFEHVADAAPQLAQLTQKCPNLRVLTTSRELLRVTGEVEYSVQPLPSRDATALFALRAGVQADEHAVELCQRLDNLPLAVELAAARAKVLSPRQILDRMASRLDLLKGGRGAEPRQQTLRSTIGWSYELLSAAERQLFARMSVFAGGCTLGSAEQVCDADLDLLQSLVEKSLVRHADERFSMLETIRDYASERLDASGDGRVLRRLHADHYLALAEDAEPHVLGTNPKEWLNLLEHEHANVRAALDWFEETGETQMALRLGGALWEFWCLRAHYTEGRRRLASLLEADPQPTIARAKALTGATHLAAHDLGGQRRSWAEEALELYVQLGDEWGTAFAEYQKATLYTEQDDFEAAVPLVQASIDRLQAAGDEHRALQAMRMLAWCHEELGDRVRQQQLTEEILERARAIDDRSMEGRALAVLAGIASDDGRSEDALAMLEQTYRIDQELGDPDEVNIDLVRLARVLAVSGRPAAAVTLVAVRQASRPDPESADTPWVLKMEQEAVRVARAALDENAFADAWAAGLRTSVEDALQQTLSPESTQRSAT